MPAKKKTESTTEVLDNGTFVLTADVGPEREPDEPENPEPEPKKPEPKPGDVDYDWSQHYDTDDLYIHTFPDGKVLALKTFGSIYSKTFLYKIQSLPTDADVEFAALHRASAVKGVPVAPARAILANLDDSEGDPIDDLYKAWMAAGTAQAEGGEGLTPGN